MNQPNIADKKPAIMELEAGTYHWCQCGLSKTKSFCDGSHAGTGFSPFEFKIADKKRVAICNCKQTKNKPYCDGAHSKL